MWTPFHSHIKLYPLVPVVDEPYVLATLCVEIPEKNPTPQQGKSPRSYVNVLKEGSSPKSTYSDPSPPTTSPSDQRLCPYHLLSLLSKRVMNRLHIQPLKFVCTEKFGHCSAYHDNPIPNSVNHWELLKLASETNQKSCGGDKKGKCNRSGCVLRHQGYTPRWIIDGLRLARESKKQKKDRKHK